MTSRNAFIGGALPLSTKSWGGGGASAPLAPPSAATAHAYFYQVQTQMYVTGFHWCDFFVWAPETDATNQI